MNTVDHGASFIKPAVDKICVGLQDGGRGQIRTMAGTGAAAIARASAQRLCAPGGTIVVLSHTRDLLDQELEKWTQTDRDHVALSVAGTPPERIADWLRAPTAAARRLIVGTHWSAEVIGAGLRRAEVTAEMLIVDQAHRVAGRAPQRLRVVHEDAHVPARRRLYVTSAPEVATDPAPDEREDFLDMNDTQVFGPVLVSNIEHVRFASPKMFDTVQMIGRTLRPDPSGTGLASILVPLLLPDGPDDRPVSPRNSSDTSRAMVRACAERLCAPGDIVIVLSSTVAQAAATILGWVHDYRGHVALAVWDPEDEPDSWNIIHELHSTTTTDPYAIAAWVTRPQGSQALRLIVAAHRSAHLMNDGLRNAGAVAGLLVIEQADEFGTSPEEAAPFLAGHVFLTARRRMYLPSAPAWPLQATRTDELR